MGLGSVLLLLQLASSADAFSQGAIPTPLTDRSSSSLCAANEPPKYDKIEGTLREAEEVATGSVMLHIDTLESIDYRPGHVLALEIEMDETQRPLDKESKTYKDAQANGGWMRGPYTVSRCSERKLNVLIKVVGTKSRRFQSAEPGTKVKFGGRFHVPILDGIDVASTDRVVMISTGVGVGPCIGAIEMALEDSFRPPIDLIASYRSQDEVVCGDILDSMQQSHPSKFAWKSIITELDGRLSANEDNLRLVFESNFDASVERTHFHLIGNAALVGEMKAGLEEGGVPPSKISIESYFNHGAELNQESIRRISNAVASMKVAAAIE
ncbi:hypothetical protein THAOC_03028 [Thalassiosira oceanica]|uniref:FAD-binding FR-type domain-containing protein n=1 Tax=Thalassiosira oceanica TaxID=159749 RepID=K0T975_THAOC|nr:hypothetical protein THAOC_03028 [Thalassiosira oceanica]|eukprot:EJK75253.1 hypothetical protein THAOC_03028 [Thalassiosira oceanica]